MFTRTRRTLSTIAIACSFGALLAACQTQDASTDAASPASPSAAPSAAAETDRAMADKAATPVALSEVHPGLAIYNQYCAACHDNAEATRSPTFATLQAMSARNLEFAMTQGKMREQASAINPADLQLLISYLVSDRAAGADWVGAMKCPADRATPKLNAAAGANGFGYDLHNTRKLTAAQAGLKTSDFANLELAWSMGFPDSTAMRAQPAIVGTTLFYPVAEASSLYAIDVADAAKPCVQWVYRSTAPLRTSAGYGELPDGRKVVFVAGLDTTLHMVDARTGAEIWKKKMGTNPFSVTTGTPVLYKDKLVVPVSAIEITVGARPTHECCKSAGSVAVLDAATGREIWHTRVIPEATPQRDRGDGQMLWGPSGAPIWNSPAVDEKRGLIYVGTGEATSAPADKNTNAIVAFDINTGAIRWSMQATPRDIFLIGCNPRGGGPNCPTDTVFRDVDFGASMILARDVDGRDLVLGGQKSGTVWALDPDTGKVVWRRDLGTGGPLGGIHWGLAADDQHVYAPISNVGRPIPGEPPIPENIKPGLYALDLKTGEIKWQMNPTADCADGRQERMPLCQRGVGFSAAPTLIDGVVIQGQLDGRLWAIEAKTGNVLWSFDTARAFDTINGVPAKGGTIDAASISAGNGMLFVNSGYGMFGQVPGNAFLAFRPKAN